MLPGAGSVGDSGEDRAVEQDLRRNRIVEI